MSYSKQKSTRTMTALGLALLVFLTFVSGIIRHDVPEKKYLKLGKQKQFDCVGQIGGGSGVLVDARHVLSAAHCFIDLDTRPDTLDTLLNGKKARLILNVPIGYKVADFSKMYATFSGRKFKVKRGLSTQVIWIL